MSRSPSSGQAASTACVRISEFLEAFASFTHVKRSKSRAMACFQLANGEARLCVRAHARVTL
jgi:hypothetical protein